MTTWKIDIYENKDDAAPSRTELVDAATETEAVEAVVQRLKSGAQRGDATPKSGSFKLGDDLDSDKKLG